MVILTSATTAAASEDIREEVLNVERKASHFNVATVNRAFPD